VEKSRGGYCVEMNTIFGDMMRALGFNVLGIAARVKPGPVYLGM
jgi:arylamine N-acetyltransferase